MHVAAPTEEGARAGRVLQLQVALWRVLLFPFLFLVIILSFLLRKPIFDLLLGLLETFRCGALSRPGRRTSKAEGEDEEGRRAGAADDLGPVPAVGLPAVAHHPWWSRRSRYWQQRGEPALHEVQREHPIDAVVQ